MPLPLKRFSYIFIEKGVALNIGFDTLEEAMLQAYEDSKGRFRRPEHINDDDLNTIYLRDQMVAYWQAKGWQH